MALRQRLHDCEKMVAEKCFLCRCISYHWHFHTHSATSGLHPTTLCRKTTWNKIRPPVGCIKSCLQRWHVFKVYPAKPRSLHIGKTTKRILRLCLPVVMSGLNSIRLILGTLQHHRSIRSPGEKCSNGLHIDTTRKPIRSLLGNHQHESSSTQFAVANQRSVIIYFISL